MSFFISQTFRLLNRPKHSILCYHTKKLLDKNIPKVFKKEKPHFIHSSCFKLTKDDSGYENDPEMQKLIKGMYEDFNLETNDDNAIKESEVSSEGKKNVSKNIDKFYENLSTAVEFNSDIIYDYDEERLMREQGLWPEKEKQIYEPVEKVIYERGKTGVFDVEELVEFLKDQKALDIVVIYVPPEISYVDYMVIATGRSLKHISVLCEHLVKLYKKKKNRKDKFLIVEGKNTEWVAMDTGNIAVHIMKEDIREEKDIETLWTVGAASDSQCLIEIKNPYSVEELRKEQEENA